MAVGSASNNPAPAANAPASIRLQPLFLCFIRDPAAHPCPPPAVRLPQVRPRPDGHPSQYRQCEHHQRVRLPSGGEIATEGMAHRVRQTASRTPVPGQVSPDAQARSVCREREYRIRIDGHSRQNGGIQPRGQFHASGGGGLPRRRGVVRFQSFFMNLRVWMISPATRSLYLATRFLTIPSSNIHQIPQPPKVTKNRMARGISPILK